MQSKTPQFDKALDEYFAKLELDEKGGQWRTCRFSGEKFYVRQEDVEFYRKMKVPLPTLAPEERRRRRCASYNSYTLFKKASAYSGKSIVSIYPPLSSYKIYEHQVWYSDAWDSLDYARPYDPAQSFFSQFRALQLEVPRASLISDPTNVNSDFTNVSKNLKNCYITFDQNGGEDLYYHQCCEQDKNCIECWSLYNSDTCYESKIGMNLFKCFWCEETHDTIESYFLWDCRNSEHCFMSSNLRNKKYYFRNEYVGKEEFEKRLREINFGNYDEVQKLKQEFREMKNQAPHKENNNQRSINVSGDYIWDSKNIHFGLWIDSSENIAYSEGMTRTRDSYDVLGGSNGELCYELANVWAENDYGCKFSMQVDNSREVEYCDSCRNCRNCFGCVGLANKEFCIFNKQYFEEEYWRVVDEIKKKMFVDKEYGEFFPPEIMPVPYRSTVNAYYPGLDDYKTAGKYGYDVSLLEESHEEVAGETVKSNELPADVKDVGDDILQKIIVDVVNNKKFRIIKPELEFYRKYGLSLPRINPHTRMSKWRKEFNIVVRFYRRKCARCSKEIQTTYAPDRPEKNIWCEACYLKELG